MDQGSQSERSSDTLAQSTTCGEVFGAGGENVKSVFRPCAEDRIDPSGEMARPEKAGPAEVLSAHYLGAENPLARIVVEGDFRAIEEEIAPVLIVNFKFAPSPGGGSFPNPDRGKSESTGGD